MKASQCTFEHMMKGAAKCPRLAEATSYVQVEYGLNELKGCWDGFVDTSDAYEQEFRNRTLILEEFTYVLGEYIEYLDESFLEQVGS